MRERRQDNAARVQRFDRVEVPADLAPPERTAQGFLLVHAAVARPGIYEYANADGSVTRELVPESELHRADSLATLAGGPITLLHPDEDVSPDNYDKLGVGTTGQEVQILQETGHVRVSMVIARRDALDAIADGVQEVSPGYTVEIDPTPGTDPKFGDYDAIQRNRVYNHVAIVPEARGGHTVRLRADADHRVTQRRIDAAPAGTWRTIHLDRSIPPQTDPQPRVDGDTMRTRLMLIAAALGLGVTHRDDKLYRADMEISEEQLVNAILEAIRGLQEQATPAEPVEGEMTLAEAKDEIARLNGELSAMRQEKADRDAAEEEEAAKADRAEVVKVADQLGIPHADWTDTLSADECRLRICKARKLVPADAVLRTDAAPDGVLPATLDGMLRALRGIRTDATEPLTIPAEPARRDGGGRSDGDPLEADPYKAHLAKLRKDRASA